MTHPPELDTSPLRRAELERKVRILTRLSEISAGLNATYKLKPLLTSIMEATAEVTDCEAASVLLWDQTINELRFAATTTGSPGADLLGKPVPLAGSIAGTVLRENRVVAVDNVDGDARHYSKLDEAIEFRTRSVLAVPMTSKDRVIGVLEAVNKRDGQWTSDDRNYVSILAAQAAVAIEGAQLVAQLQKANEELSQLDKLKTDFIAIASHELRTPLGVILGYASFLQETSDSEVSQHASKVVNSALHLRGIIEDLTNLRYLQTNEADLHREPMPIGDLLRDVEQELLALAGAKIHTLRLAAPPDTAVLVDRIRMGMALVNVVNNAIRFTPDGGQISIQCDLRPPYLHVAVTDTGIGFTRDQAEKIFEKFYQIEDHMTRKHGGLGIGLSIARSIVEAHGGRIWAYSPGLNQGATFTLTMPLHTE